MTGQAQSKRAGGRPGRRRADRWVALAVVAFLGVLLGSQTAADAQPPATIPPHVGPPARSQTMTAHSATFDVRRLPGGGSHVSRDAFPEREEPGATVSGDLAAVGSGVPSGGSAPAPATSTSFEGLAFNDTCGATQCGNGHPPDTNGDVGPTYYIQTVNTSIGIFDKATGSRVAAFGFDAFMSQGQFGNLCDTDNFGDPVVVYDTFADRWIISDFAFQIDGSGNVVNPPGSFQCFAVSQSGDPVVGGWNFYSLHITDGLQDYPKLGIWGDGLYMSANMFGFAANSPFQNTRIWAIDKAAMEAGQDATAVSFDAVSKTGPCGVFTLLPANARAQTGAPPAGSPEYFASTWCYTSRVRVWTLHADFATPGNSTFSGPTDSGTATSWAAPPSTVAELGGNNLDTLAMRLMMQLQYSNIGGVESLWATHTVAGSSGSQAAVRWYQVPVTGGVIGDALQASTYNPDTSNRWMASLAVDRLGDMAIGYSVSDATMHPAIRYAGRLAGDTANAITQSEQSLIEGAGSQLGNCGGGACARWGDYSAMTLDPDGCTFWYTTEYYADDSLNDHTRIGSFAYPGCLSAPPPTPSPSAAPTPTPTAGPTPTPTPTPTLAPTPTISPAPTADTTAPSVATPVLTPPTQIPGGSVTVTATATDPSGVASAQVQLDGGSWIAMTASDGSFGGTSEGLTASITAPPATGSHTVCVRATDGSPAHNTSNGTACATLTVKSFSLAPSPASASVGQGAGTTYAITITRSSFPDSIGFSVSGLPAGATGSFSPTPTTGTSTVLTVTTSNCGTITPRGTYTLTVTGLGAGLSRSTTVSLTVTNAGARISSGPTSSLYSISTLASTTMPVRTRWTGCDADGVAGYQAQRSINGGAWTSITLPSATTTTLVQSLSIGSTYRYRVRARDTLGVYGSWRYGPTFRPLATDQASSAVTWGGSWATASTTSAFKGSLRYSNSANAWSSYTFNGASVAWVAYRGPTRGSAKVYLDGVYQGTVSLYASTTAARPIIYAFNWSATGTHTIKVVVVGTAGHPRVDVDAFILLYRY